MRNGKRTAHAQVQDTRSILGSQCVGSSAEGEKEAMGPLDWGGGVMGRHAA